MQSLYTFADYSMLIAIWIVQLIVYPNFRKIPADGFSLRHQRYTQTMGYIVGPLMIIQLMSLLVPIVFQEGLSIFRASLVSLTWISTFVLFVPLHSKLVEHGKVVSVLNRLVSSNWIRTALWSLIPIAP